MSEADNEHIAAQREIERADALLPPAGDRRRRREPRIDDPHTHPRRYVSLGIAADYLEVDPKTLNYYISDLGLTCSHFGRRRKIEVVELVAFEERARQRKFHVK